MAWPQVQVFVLPLEMVVAGAGVDVDTCEGVVVDARVSNNNKLANMSWKLFFNSPEVKSVVTCAEQQITAKNPLAVKWVFVWNLIVMVALLVKGPGIEVPRYF